MSDTEEIKRLRAQVTSLQAHNTELVHQHRADMALAGRDPFGDVVAFHEAMGQPVGAVPKLLTSVREKMRLDLIMEERDELDVAIEADDLPEMADALIDLIYVCIGYMVELGIDPGPMWDEVHRTNMAKRDGKVRADGKILKPEGWQPPRIAELLNEQGWEQLPAEAPSVVQSDNRR